MLDECVRMTENWAKSTPNGLNAIAADIPHTTGDAWVTLPIASDITDKQIAANLEPSEVPSCMIFGESAGQIPLNHTEYKIGNQIAIALAFVSQEDADPQWCQNQSGIFLRAGLIMMNRFKHQNKSRAFRELDGVRVLGVLSVTEHRLPVALGRFKLWGMIDARLIAVDTVE